jgi:hypothetical protein
MSLSKFENFLRSGSLETVQLESSPTTVRQIFGVPTSEGFSKKKKYLHLEYHNVQLTFQNDSLILITIHYNWHQNGNLLFVGDSWPESQMEKANFSNKLQTINIEIRRKQFGIDEHLYFPSGVVATFMENRLFSLSISQESKVSSQIAFSES